MTSAFCHEVLFYDSAEEFLEGTVPFVRGALEAEEPALIAVGPEKIELLEGEFGADAARVRFTNMEELGRNPARIIPVWREFVDEHGGRPVRGIGEPIWPGRSPTEVDECQRHESLLNVAFEGAPAWSLLCPYDSVSLDDDILEAARRCHPYVASAGVSRQNEAFLDSGHGPGPFVGALPAQPLGSETLAFDRDSLHEVRRFVHRHAERAGLSFSLAEDLAAAVSEVAANSILHGGGKGTVSVWREDATLVVEAEDLGCIEEPLAGRLRPAPTEGGGRGLWLANQLCDLVQIRSAPGGTVIRLHMNLGFSGS